MTTLKLGSKFSFVSSVPINELIQTDTLQMDIWLIILNNGDYNAIPRTKQRDV